MHRPPLPVISVGLLLALASPGFALVVQYDREEVGPAKATLGPPYANPESAFRLSPLRCYWRESGFDGFGTSRHGAVSAFRGDVDEANAALAAFATLSARDKVVRIFPGPGSVRSTDGKASYPCDWEVRWARHAQYPRGQQKESTETHSAVLTLFVACAEPAPKADPRAGRWVKELDDDSLQVREDATRALAALGDAALPALREAMGKNPSAEQRRRITRLIGRLRPISLSRVKLPRGVRVVSLDALVKEAEGDWRSGDLARAWQAAPQLSEWADYSEDTFPHLIEALLDRREQVRGAAEAAFARLGKRGAGALAGLKAADARADDQRVSLKKAIQSVGNGADKASVDDHWRENRRLRAAIAEYCRSAAKQP